MRYFEKKPIEQRLPLFQQWETENREAILAWMDNPAKTGDMLWAELGKTFGIERDTKIDPMFLRNELETVLFEEQNGLCCYCGNSISRSPFSIFSYWVYSYKAIEHFDPKNKFKLKTFLYLNLMFCCKESQLLTVFEVGRTYNKGKTTINSFEDVAAYLKLPVSIVKENPRNASILKRPLVKGDKIYVPNPPHCDDAKSAFDAKKEHTIIINPSQDKELIEKLIFKDNGEISYQNRETIKDDIIENTFTVLGLNCSTLVERRQEKWLDSYIIYKGDDGILLDIDDKDTLLNIINKLIEGKSRPNDEGLLEAFYFVEIALLKSLLNGY